MKKYNKCLYDKGLRKCFSCKKIKSIVDGDFYTSKRYGDKGYSYRCKDCDSKIKRSGKYKKRKKSWIRNRFGEYVSSARVRNRKFSLSKDEFSLIINLPCIYCGKKSSIDRPSGVDRIDNSLGYTINNSVPCCRECNYEKGRASINSIKNFYRVLKERKLV